MREIVTASQAAEVLGVDKRTVLRFARDGKLRSYRTPGGQHRFQRADVERLAAGEGNPACPSASTLQTKRDEIEAINLEVQTRRARRELARAEAEDAETASQHVEARRQAEQEGVRAEHQRKETERLERAERRERAAREAQAKRRRAWESGWIDYAMKFVPDDASYDVRSSVRHAACQALADLTPDHAHQTVGHLVESAALQALEPVRRAREIEQALEDALRELPFQIRSIRLGLGFDQPLTDWETRAKHQAQRAAESLPSNASLIEIRAAAREAVRNVAKLYEQHQAEQQHKRQIDSVMAWISGEDGRDVVRDALGRLPVGCGRAQLEHARDLAIAPIHERQREAAEAKRKEAQKEAQAAWDADRYLWRVTEYIEELAREGDCNLGFWDRCQLAQKIKKEIRPQLIQHLLRDELDADGAREFIEEAVDREI